jgi:hypothetical protein
MELGSYFWFLQEQIKDIIIDVASPSPFHRKSQTPSPAQQ